MSAWHAIVFCVASTAGCSSSVAPPVSPPSLQSSTVDVATNGEVLPSSADSTASDDVPLVATSHQEESAAKEKRKRKELVKFGIAMHMFHDAYGHFPSLDSAGGDLPQGLSWRVHILPYIGEAELHGEFRLEEPWDSPHNLKLIPKMPKVYGDSSDGKTRIHVFTGDGAPFQPKDGITIAAVFATDQATNTIMVVEAGDDSAETWTRPTGLVFNPDSPLEGLGKFGERFYAVMMDGRVCALPKSINPELFSQLVRFNDGKPTKIWSEDGKPD
jgi:hypothetical protein